MSGEAVMGAAAGDAGAEPCPRQGTDALLRTPGAAAQVREV